jgi:hypothetical protein
VPRHKKTKTIPPPRYGITKDIFLYKIGKSCEEYKDKFESWEKLFSLKSKEMRGLGIPAKQRKWILNWTEKYRQGIEPYAIRFKSRSVKYKALYLENRRTHMERESLAKQKKRFEKRKAKLQLKEELKAATVAFKAALKAATPVAPSASPQAEINTSKN